MSSVRERAVALVSRTPLELPARAAWRALYRSVPDRWLSVPERKSRNYDRMTVKIAERILAPDSNTVDAGAHLGDLLKEFVRLAPHGTHIAIEPLPGFAGRLERKFPHVTVAEAALGSKEGSARFVVAGDRARSHLAEVSDNPEDDGRANSLVVPVITDQLVPPDLSISLIKIDMEGA